MTGAAPKHLSAEEHRYSPVLSSDGLFSQRHRSAAAAHLHRRETRCRGNARLPRLSLLVFGKQRRCQHPETFLCRLHRGWPDFFLTSDIYSTNCASDQILFFHPKECCSEITSRRGGRLGGREGWRERHRLVYTSSSDG